MQTQIDQETMSLEQAAEFLHLHPETLRFRAKRGLIPGAKIGRAWVFLKVDLVEYLRAQYQCVEAVGLPHGELSWQKSTEGKAVNIGGHASNARAEAAYLKALARKTKPMLKSTQINVSMKSGRK